MRIAFKLLPWLLLLWAALLLRGTTLDFRARLAVLFLAGVGGFVAGAELILTYVESVLERD